MNGSERESTAHDFGEGLFERSSPKSTTTWAYLIESLEEEPDQEMALLQKFAGELPLQWRRVPDFRIPPEVRKRWKKTRAWLHVKRLIHLWRMKHDTEYMAWIMRKEEGKLRRKDRENAWDKSAQRARRMLRDIESRGKATYSDLFMMESQIAVLEDRFSSTTEKMRAVTAFGSTAAKYEVQAQREVEAEKEVKEDLKQATPQSIASMFEHLGRLQSEQVPEPSEPQPDDPRIA